jgi:hypothetical protein
MMAYARRKAWENGTLAAALAGFLTLPGAVEGPRPERRSGPRWVAPHALLAEMGVKL